jgi:hypothetical protein
VYVSVLLLGLFGAVGLFPPQAQTPNISAVITPSDSVDRAWVFIKCRAVVELN